MIFSYKELKDYVSDDFERFYKMGFDEQQIFPAVLNEYTHGEDFCQTENICIHILLGVNYAKKGLNMSAIKEKLEQLISKDTVKEIRVELGREYTEFILDLDSIMVHE